MLSDFSGVDLLLLLELLACKPAVEPGVVGCCVVSPFGVFDAILSRGTFSVL